MDIPELLAIPAYFEELAEHLRSTELELWEWFSESSELANRQDDEAELALLKSAYRLDGGAHGVLAAHATMLAARFGIDERVNIYQHLGETARNAHVFRLNGQVHVVFSGDILDLLEPTEHEAILAHELAHIALWNQQNETFLVLDHMVHRLASEPTASDAVIETARRVRLRTEVWADRVAADVIDDPPLVIAAIVKVGAGIRHVDPEAYLRQAAQILEMDSSSSQAWTHPELHLRVACIEATLRGSPDHVITELVFGPDDLDRLDLLGQVRMQRLTERILRSGIAAYTDGDLEGARLDDADALESYLGAYPGLEVRAAQPIHDGELAGYQPSIRWMAAAMLVDLVLLADAPDSLDDVVRVSAEARRQGVHDEFDLILAKATDQTVAQTSAIRRVGA